MRWRSIKSRSGSPSAVRTTWSSHTFSLSVLPMMVGLLLVPQFPHDVPRCLTIPTAGKLIYALAFQHARRQYQGMDNSSGVGVLDKAALVLSALETGPTTLAGLVAATGLARPTAHRLAVALEHHRLVSRDLQGRFVLGPRLGELASAAGEDRL